MLIVDWLIYVWVQDGSVVTSHPVTHRVQEFLLTQAGIARARIIVERTIGRLNNFEILDGNITFNMDTGPNSTV